MKLWDDYISYLKDNPEGYWFKRKPYGYGWTPVKPAGFAVTFGFIFLIIGIATYFELTGELEREPEKFVTLLVSSVILLIAICWKTGEPLKWQWGQGEKEDKE